MLLDPGGLRHSVNEQQRAEREADQDTHCKTDKDREPEGRQ